MNRIMISSLLASAALAASGSASAVQVQLTEIGLRAGSGTSYSLITTGSTATWDWSGGVLTQTGGVLTAEQRLGSTPAGTWLLTDRVTGLVLDTNSGTTSAATYDCIEGTFGATTGGHSCGNINMGGDFTLNSTINYNVGGMADCQTFTLAGDDAGGVPMRGLRSWNGGGTCADNTGRGALDMVNVIENSLVIENGNVVSGRLLLGNANGAVDASCYAFPAAGNAACGRAHWMEFSAVPAPAAAWLIAPAVLAAGRFSRRRKAA